MRKEGLDEERGEKEGVEIRERRRTEGIVANPSRPSLSLSPGLASRGLAGRERRQGRRRERQTAGQPDGRERGEREGEREDVRAAVGSGKGRRERRMRTVRARWRAKEREMEID